MSIASEITRIQGNVADAYTAASNKGAILPVTQNSDNLASTINSISTGITPTGTKQITSNGTHDVTDYATADVQVPTTAPELYRVFRNNNGKLENSISTPFLTLPSSITDIDEYALANAYKGTSSSDLYGAIDLSSLEQLSGGYACYTAFQGCAGITSVDMSNVSIIKQGNTCQNMFNNCTGLISADLGKLKMIESYNGYCCKAMFYNCSAMTSFDLSSLEVVGTNSGQSECGEMFRGCKKLTTASLSKLNTIKNTYACYLMFENCEELVSADLSGLIVINGSSAIASMFQFCKKLTSVDISKLVTINGGSALNHMFYGCTLLTELSFDNLAYTTVDFNNSLNGMLDNVTGCTVHFPAEWQTTMSNWSNVTNGFGGTNTTVLFDLPNVRALDLSHITEVIGNRQFNGEIANRTTITSVDLSGLIRVDGYSGCQKMFQNCTGLVSADLSKLEAATNFAPCAEMFLNCSAMTSFDLSSLVVATGGYAFSHTFEGCDITGDVVFDSLKTMKNSSEPFQQTFKGNTNLTSVSFPALKELASMVSTNNSTFKNMLDGVTGCTVHFPSNMSYYTFDIGGTNTTVLYDLPATNILTGANTTEYERNPKYDTATALAWRVKDTGTAPNLTIDWTPYYTSGTTDPAVSDTIYSDSACTVAVTTISSIA